ncbi:protein seele [Linepithema humile]|uniref:protein seele n=1 Tax=Linepithema humile TaxID=83485 RepID=UPI0006238ED0|nr:PREDICTED: protein canopy homolog 2 [Linepithema humile]
MRALLIVSLCLMTVFTASAEIDFKHLKCLVCRTTMKELEAEVSKANPNKVVEVGSFRMDAKGNTIHKKVPLTRSEVYISEVLDNVCEKMTDYVRAIKKSNSELILFNLVSSTGGMNPRMNEIDIIQDGDLNKSLQHYCSVIVEEYEEDIVSLYVNGASNKKEKLCTKISNICKNYVDDDEDTDADNATSSTGDFSFEAKDEL